MSEISFPLKIHYKENNKYRRAIGFVFKKDNDSVTFKFYNYNTKKITEKLIKNQHIINIYDRKTGRKVNIWKK